MNRPGEAGCPIEPTEVCVVVPCYNEEKRIDKRRFCEFLAPIEGPRLLFVDDGSSDGTRDVLHSLCQVNPRRAAVLACDRNSGKAEAVRRGVLHALDRAPIAVVGYWDCDLATPLSAIFSFTRVLERNPGVEMVFGARVKLLGRHVERRAIRHYLGRVFATAVSTVLDLSIYDTQCGAKLFRVDETLRAIFAEPFRSKWVFDVEILARYSRTWRHDRQRLEKAIYEYPLESWVDVAGSKVRPKDFFRAFW
jgi:dolichyl-phosphate beta-glucosyltransferase